MGILGVLGCCSLGGRIPVKTELTFAVQSTCLRNLWVRFWMHKSFKYVAYVRTSVIAFMRGKLILTCLNISHISSYYGPIVLSDDEVSGFTNARGNGTVLLVASVSLAIGVPILIISSFKFLLGTFFGLLICSISSSSSLFPSSPKSSTTPQQKVVELPRHHKPYRS